MAFQSEHSLLKTVNGFYLHSALATSTTVLYFQRCIVMRLFYFSYKQVKHDFSLFRSLKAIICGMFNITVNCVYLHAQNQGKLASVCLHRFSSTLPQNALRRDCNGKCIEIIEGHYLEVVVLLYL